MAGRRTRIASWIRLWLLLLAAGAALGATLAWRVTLAQDLRLQYGDRVQGEIGSTPAADTWRFSGGASDRVTIRVERIEGDLVPSLLVRDPGGQVVLDLPWPLSDSTHFETTVRLANGGEHTIELRARQNTAGRYALSLILAQAGTAARRDVALSYGQTVEGDLIDPMAQDVWSFRSEPGDVVDVTVIPSGGTFRPEVTLFSPTGSVVATTGGAGSTAGAGLSAVRLPLGGTYTVAVRPADARTGAYRLTVHLRSSSRVDTGFVPMPLELGSPARSRLTGNAPVALFSVRASGTLALALDASNPQARIAVNVLSENRAVLDSFAGLGSVRASLSLGSLTGAWLEITSPDVDLNTSLDFAVEVIQLRMARRTARALPFDASRHAQQLGEPDVWFFDARAGDLMRLSLRPDVFSSGGIAQVYSPQGDLLFQRWVAAGFDQALLLEQAGVYEVVLRALGVEGYLIGLTRSGAGGQPFDLLVDRVERGLLGSPPEPRGAGELSPQSGDEWTLNIDQPGVWAFELAGPPDGPPLALRVESPIGELLDQRVGKPVNGLARLVLEIPAPGRYRIAVLNMTAEQATYTLRAEPITGGLLVPGVPARGALSGSSAENRWTICVAAPALLQVRVESVPDAALPELLVVQPDGLLAPLIPIDVQQPEILSAPVAESGLYTIVVHQPPGVTHTRYLITAAADPPFDPTPPVAQMAAAGQASLIATPEPVTEPLVLDPAEQILPASRPGPDVLANAQPIALDTTVRGEIPLNARYQVWRFQAGAGQKVDISAIGLARATAPDITLLDEEGAVLARSVRPDRLRNTLEHRFAAAGRYYITVRYDPGRRYLLRVDDLSRLDDSVRGVLPGHVIDFGQTLHAELPGVDAPLYAVFYAQDGDQIRIQAARPAGSGGLQLSLETVGGGVLAATDVAPDTPWRASLDARVANEGVYRLVVEPVGGESAASPVAIHLALRGASALSRDGRALDTEGYGNLDPDNPADVWLFSALGGERVSIAVQPVDGQSLPLTVELADTAGVPFLRRASMVGASTVTLESISLPRPGVYRLLVRTSQGERGLYRVTLTRDLSSLSDAQQALSLNRTVSRVLTAENRIDVWAFAGTKGDVISAEARAIRGDPALLSFQIRTQTGAVLTTAAADASGRAVAPQVLLPETGHYTLAVGNVDTTFDGALAYDLTVLLESTQARSMGGVLSGSGYGAGVLSGADLRDVWLFLARQGDLVRASVTAQGGGVAASIMTTDWHIASTAGRPSTLTVADSDDEGTLLLEAVVIPADGVYTIDVSAPPNADTRYTVRLELEPAGAQPAVPVVPPQQVEGRISLANLHDAWMVEGRQGDTLSVRVVADSRATLAPVATVYGPQGEPLVQVRTTSDREARLESYALPQTGSYTVEIGRRLAESGETEGRYRAEIELASAPPVAARLLRYGQVGRSWLNTAAPVEQWTFEGEAGDVVEAQLAVVGGSLDPVMRLYGPDEALLAVSGEDTIAGARVQARLPASGTYRIEVARLSGVFGTGQGNYALSLNRTYRVADLAAQPMLGYGQRAIGAVDATTTQAYWMFAGAAGDSIRASVRFPTDDAPLVLTVADPAGDVLASGTRAGGRATIEGLTLPSSGLYVLEVRRLADARAPYSPYELELALIGGQAGRVQAGGLLDWGQPSYGRIEDPSRVHLWTFRASRGDQAVLAVARLEGVLAVELTLLAPDGTTLLDEVPAPGAGTMMIGPLIFQETGIYTLVVAARDEALGLRYRVQLMSLSGEGETPPD